MNRKHIQDTFDYFLHFTEIYRTNENKYLREARILKLQIPHILQDFQKGDLLAGSIHHTFIGFSPQYGGKYIYFFEEDQARKLLDDNREFLSRIDEIEAAIAYNKAASTLLRKGYLKDYPVNYIEELSDSEYRSRYQVVDISDKIKVLKSLL